MVLNHVTYGPAFFVITTAAFDADCFGVRDLNVIYILTVPERLPNAVGKTKHKQVLHGLLAEVMVDTIDLILLKDRGQFFVEDAGALEIMTERLFDNDPGPTVFRFCERGGAELLDDWNKELRRSCQIEDAIVLSLTLGFDRSQFGLQSCIGICVAKIARDVGNSRGETLPRWFVDLRLLAEFGKSLSHAVAEFLIAHLLSSGANNCELRWYQSLLRHAKECGDKFAFRKVTSSAKNNDDAWRCHALQTHACTQRVFRFRICHVLCLETRERD